LLYTVTDIVRIGESKGRGEGAQPPPVPLKKSFGGIEVLAYS